MIFFIFSFLLSICAIIENRLLFKFSALIVGFYFSFTFAYGFDWLNYYQSYRALATGGDPFFGDIGFIFLMKVCLYFGLGYPGFNFVTNALLYFFIYKFCDSLKSPSFAFLTLFSFLGFFMFTEQIRQGFALAIILFGLSRYFYTSKIKFTLSVFVACFFHISAILSLFYFITINKTKRKFIISVLLSVSLYLVFILLLLNPSFVAVFQAIETKFQTYGTMYNDLNTNFITFIIHSKMLFVYVLIMLLLKLFNYKGTERYSVYSNLFMLVLTRSSSLLVRLSYYFLPIFVFSIDEYINELGKGFSTNWKKLVLILLVLFVSTLPVWTPMYDIGSRTHLSLLSSSGDLNREIGRKCQVLHINSDIRTDGCS